MNLPLNKPSQGDSGNSGGVGLGGPCAPSERIFTVGEIGFGPGWQDDEPSLRNMYETACQTIVRLECEADELRARVALLEEEQRILARTQAPRLTDEDEYVQLTAKGRALLEGLR